MSCGDDRLIRTGPTAIRSRASRFAYSRGMHGLKGHESGHLATFRLHPGPPGPPANCFVPRPFHAPADPPVLMLGWSSEEADPSSEEVDLSIARRVGRRWQSSSGFRVWRI